MNSAGLLAAGGRQGRVPEGLSTPAARLAARLYALVFDHGLARLWWKNRAEVAPGVWRMNQPSEADLQRLAMRGVRTILNLRGESRRGYRRLEDAACARLGLRLVAVRMRARAAPSREALLALIDALERAELPMVMHCKSGADRTGMAAAVWRLVRAGDGTAAAMRQLSPRYGHNCRGAAGVQGQVLRAYAADGEARGVGFRDWVAQDYDPASVTRDFARWRAARR